MLCVLLASDPVPEAVLEREVLKDPEADHVLVGSGVTLTVDDLEEVPVGVREREARVTVGVCRPVSDGLLVLGDAVHDHVRVIDDDNEPELLTDAENGVSVWVVTDWDRVGGLGVCEVVGVLRAPELLKDRERVPLGGDRVQVLVVDRVRDGRVGDLDHVVVGLQLWL